jgi:predicted transcriptional regulator
MLKKSPVKHRSFGLKELLLLIALKLEGPIGRYRLKEILDLSEHEGVVRLMLSRLQSSGWISAGKLGCSLTETGRSRLKRLMAKNGIVFVTHLNAGPLKTGLYSALVHLEGCADKAVAVVKHRDAAVRVGAEGATIVVFQNGILTVPNVYPDLCSEYPEIADMIIQSFHPSEGDVFIISFSDNKWKALEGALASAISLQK